MTLSRRTLRSGCPPPCRAHSARSAPGWGPRPCEGSPPTATLYITTGALAPGTRVTVRAGVDVPPPPARRCRGPYRWGSDPRPLDTGGGLVTQADRGHRSGRVPFLAHDRRTRPRFSAAIRPAEGSVRCSANTSAPRRCPSRESPRRCSISPTVGCCSLNQSDRKMGGPPSRKRCVGGRGPVSVAVASALDLTHHGASFNANGTVSARAPLNRTRRTWTPPSRRGRSTGPDGQQRSDCGCGWPTWCHWRWRSAFPSVVHLPDHVVGLPFGPFSQLSCRPGVRRGYAAQPRRASAVVGSRRVPPHSPADSPVAVRLLRPQGPHRLSSRSRWPARGRPGRPKPPRGHRSGATEPGLGTTRARAAASVPEFRGANFDSFQSALSSSIGAPTAAQSSGRPAAAAAASAAAAVAVAAVGGGGSLAVYLVIALVAGGRPGRLHCSATTSCAAPTSEPTRRSGGIDVQLTRRASLIPQSGQHGPGFAAHEKSVLEHVATPRPR